MKFKQILNICLLVVVALGFTIGASVQTARAQVTVFRTIVFPVIGAVSYYDDFGAPRSGGRSHEGNDLMGKKMLPLVAAVDGTVTNVNYPEADWGYAVTIRDSDGYTYHYLHINNDNPGTDDGKGDGKNAYAPDIQEGNKVVKGQLIGYMGDSGNAETTTAHLHFEIRAPGREPFSPYESLKAATKITTPVTNYPAQQNEILPYESFKGGANIATGNIDSDSDLEIATGAGATGGPLVKLFDKDGTAKGAWYAYGETFRGGVDVAMGDVDKDGQVEVITAAGPGGGPHIRIFKANGTVLKEFFAYDTKFRGGVHVASADVNNDGAADIITGAGPGGGPHVKVFSGADLTLIKEFLAYDGKFRGGVDVAAAKTASNTGAVITSPLAGGGPHIKIFNIDGTVAREFFAYDGNFNLGVRVSAGTLGSSGIRLAVVPATGGGPHMKTFNISDGVVQNSGLYGFESWWRGGYDVAFLDSRMLMSAMDGRRASLRSINLSSSSGGSGSGGSGSGGSGSGGSGGGWWWNN
ncbi:VCBS repeat domain-containing M23 family metallopeptidase [bacterium]|nr:MAG: VCBS repeat domain-containing M23 family metallopeptidase [bacterium]